MRHVRAGNITRNALRAAATGTCARGAVQAWIEEAARLDAYDPIIISIPEDSASLASARVMVGIWNGKPKAPVYLNVVALSDTEALVFHGPGTRLTPQQGRRIADAFRATRSKAGGK